ncbi:MAG: citrate lyase acyl carrier protein [Clostridia bacterium]|nr:citrate lyase acyl carrier protein [Clostridia bacterium]
MGKVLQRATAGTLESSDVFVSIEPCEQGLTIHIDSVVMKQFGDDILTATKDVLREFEIENAKVSVKDRGALECVLRARVECAVLRAKGEC